MLGFNCMFIIEQIETLCKNNPNDYFLGEKVRSLFGDDESIKQIPNNFSLGNIIRKYINTIK